MSCSRRAALVGVALLALVAGACTGPPSTTPTALTSGPSDASDINDSGWVVGDMQVGSGDLHAFVARPGRSVVDLGTLGGSHSRAEGINDTATVVGASRTDHDSNQEAAFRWTLTGGLQPLPGPADQDGRAMAINNHGMIVGSLGTCCPRQAVVWTTASTPPELLPLPTGATWSDAVDINDRGDIVGTVAGPANDYAPIPAAWERDRTTGTWTPITLIDWSPEEVGGGEAAAINDAGDIVGHVLLPVTGVTAVRWAAGTHRRTDLPKSPPRSPIAANALGINGAGIIVGGDGHQAVAWIDRPDGTIEERILAAPPEGTPGWFATAVATNDHDAVALTYPIDPDAPGARAVRQWLGAG